MRQLLLSISAYFLLYGAISAQNELSLFDTLYRTGEVRILITCAIDSLYRTQREEVDATITITTANGCLLQEEPMSLNLRGKFRRMKCVMPPLMLNFKKSTLRKLGLQTLDEIKLVTHCLDGREGQENLEEERLCYQLYEALTVYSYRTIWVHVTYQDAHNPDRQIQSAGFLLEPDKVMAARLNLKEKKVFNVTEDSLDLVSYSHAVAFNFLIGNRDWSIVASRNAKLFYDNHASHYIVIPYDFDYANVVGATYRRESPSKAITHPFDRIYQGEYFTPSAGKILQEFLATEPVMLNVVQTAINPLDKSRRKKIGKYFEEWYTHIRKVKPENLQYGMVCPYRGSL